MLVVVSAAWECLTHIGLLKIHRTNTLKLFSSIRHTMPFVVIQKSIGSAKLSKNIVNYVVLHQLAKALVVLAKAIDTPKPLVDHVGLLGAAEIVSICTANDKLIRTDDENNMFCCIFLVHTHTHTHCILVYWNIRMNNIFNNKRIILNNLLFSKICFDCVFIYHYFIIQLLVQMRHYSEVDQSGVFGSFVHDWDRMPLSMNLFTEPVYKWDRRDLSDSSWPEISTNEIKMFMWIFFINLILIEFLSKCYHIINE